MKKVNWQPGTTNVDIGGGRFDTATEYLREQGVENLVFDPFNRNAEHNKEMAERVRDSKVDTATCHNVLNVIDSELSRANVILQAAKAIKPDGTAYFTVYEGDKSGVGRQTKSDSWQTKAVSLMNCLYIMFPFTKKKHLRHCLTPQMRMRQGKSTKVLFLPTKLRI